VRLENNAVFSSTAERSARGAVTGEFYQQATFVTALPAGLDSDRVMHPRCNAMQRKNRRMAALASSSAFWAISKCLSFGRVAPEFRQGRHCDALGLPAAGKSQ
jgi:hypothetical protein